MVTNDQQYSRTYLEGLLVHCPSLTADCCPMCRSWRPIDEKFCDNCSQVFQHLSQPCTSVVPISLYSKPSTLRDWLKYYKPNAEEYVPRFSEGLAAIIRTALTESSNPLEYVVGEWDAVVVVPSSNGRVPHPFESVLAGAGLEKNLMRPLQRTAVPLNHRVMSDEAYVPNIDVAGAKVLLFDDVYTTGSRSQSAASALQNAGADVLAVVVVGRRINPEFNDRASKLWTEQVVRKFSFQGLFY